MSLPSFLQVTFTLSLPLNATLKVRGWPTLNVVFSSFLMKRAGSVRSSDGC